MRADTSIYEVNQTLTLREIVEGLLEDWKLTVEQLSERTGLSVPDLQDFLGGAVEDLSSTQYRQIESTLNLPTDYFARCKVMYAERAAKLAQTA